MTEVEWLSCTYPKPMLAFLKGKASDRKLRLFAVACCRRIWHLLTDDRSRKVVQLSEKYAEYSASHDELTMALNEAIEAAQTGRPPSDAAEAACFEMAVNDLGMTGAADAAADAAAHATATTAYQEAAGYDYDPAAISAERVEQYRLLADIVGNPFHPTTLDPVWTAWKDAPVVRLAQGIYEERAFDRLPILADALEKAGCTDRDILDHCRGPGTHVRGCWVIDLLLGKE
jgi:hypothetical protein